MTPPLCIGCGVRPVKRCMDSARVTVTRGKRIAGGKRWRWFCSQTCCGRDTGTRNMGLPQVQAAVHAHQDAAKARRLARWIALAREASTDGMVSVVGMVRILAAVEAKGYSRGYERGRYRSRVWSAA